MNPYALSGLLAGISSLCFGFLVLFKSPNKRIARIWLLFTLSAAGYEFGVIGIGIAKTSEGALLSARLAYAFGVIWIASVFNHFVCNFLETKSRRSILANYAISMVFLLTLPTSIFFHHASWVFDSMYYPRAGRLFPLFFTWWMALVLYGHCKLLRAYKFVSVEKRNQIKYFFVAMAIGFTGGSLAYLPNFGIYVYPWGNFTVCLYPFIMSYAIIKHRLMDISVIIRKTVIYSVVTGIMAAIVVLVAMVSAHFTAGVLGHQTFFALAAATCVISILFHPLQMKVQGLVDRYLFRDWSERGEMVREVASGFSHELKSPLAGLSMQVQLTMAELEDIEKGNGSLREALPKIKDNLRYILNQAMDAARRIEAVRGVAEPIASQIGSVDVSSVVDSGLATFESRLGQADVSVRRDLPADLPPVRSNEKQLEIVFINLIKNALDAMDGDNKDKHSLFLSGQVQNGSVLISVKDTGPGIASKDMGRIFEPYFSTKGRKGTGMGLYLAHQIVKAHGGSIEVKSEEGKGAEFIVRLSKYETRGEAAA